MAVVDGGELRPIVLPWWFVLILALWTLPVWWFCYGSSLHHISARVIPMNVPCCESCAARWPEQAATYLAACR